MFLLNPYRYAVASGYDSDAQAFFTATGISDTTIKTAVNQLVLDLKAASIWTKMTAIYPFVGGTSSTHSYNLKNTAAYQITWNGTVTHNANGITGNGTNGYGNTNLACSVLTANDTHLSIYSRTTGGTTDNMIEMGATNGSSTTAHYIAARWNNAFYGASYNDSGGTQTVNITNTDAAGFYLTSRRSTTDFEGYKNSASQQTKTATSTGSLPTTRNVYVGALNNGGTAAFFSNRNIAFASIGASLTDAEESAFFTAVETFQDALSRGVV